MTWHALTIFLSAFLLFLVQPLIGKSILPWFGGGAGVWSACMMFFQVLLLAGYAYAHLLSRFKTRWQATVHLILIAASLMFMPLMPAKPIDVANPTWNILSLLLIHIGVPYLILSSTGPLLQHWFSRTYQGRSPYRLYALSNTGSLLALLSYPFLVEPMLTLQTQGMMWSYVYAVFAVICGYCAWQFFRVDRDAAHTQVHAARKAHALAAHRKTTLVLWVALPAIGSVMLLATTNRICQDLAVVPFLWVLPLAIYLTSFIICFDHDAWYKRWVFMPLLAAAGAATVYLLFTSPWDTIDGEIFVYALILFACCMTCHGELVRLKPEPSGLTRFYLAVAAGGALGGVFVALVAPQIFNDYWEYHGGLLLTCLLAMVCMARQPCNWRPIWHRTSWVVGSVAFCALAVGLFWQAIAKASQEAETSRTFYGVLHVYNIRDDYKRITRTIVHGRTMHGSQFTDPKLRHWPTSYYGRDSGIGMVLDRRGGDAAEAAARPKRHIGVVGLGAGTISTYGRSGDTFRFYEISPDVVRMARTYFTYLKDSQAQLELVIGDARVSLEHEVRYGKLPQFDVLAVDAFNSDAPPLHLLTQEAFALYWSRLKPDGVLALHVSNKYVNMAPVARGLALQFGREALIIDSVESQWLGTADSSWVIVTNNPTFLNDKTILVASSKWHKGDSPPFVWTDDHTSLWSALGGKHQKRRWAMPLYEGRFVVDEAELIEHNDEDRIENLCRNLYRDTDGAHPILVITIEGMEARGFVNILFNEFTYGLARRAAMIYEHLDAGLMVVVSKYDQEATIGPGSSQALQKILDEHILAGLTEDNASEGITAGVVALDRLVRQKITSNGPALD